MLTAVSRKREQLLGYLLGALDEAERVEIERELAQSPGLREELQQLRQMLEPLEEAREPFEPPPGLAERTCAAVAAQGGELTKPRQSARAAVDAVASWHSASLLDFVVAAGICLALSLLFFPALLSSRETSRRLSCQNNLRQLGLALASYSESHHTIPAIPSEGNAAFAGYYAVQLREAGLLDDGSILLCPGAPRPLGIEQLRIPTAVEVMTAEAPRLRTVQRETGGSYGYSIGYLDGGRYRTPCLRGQAHILVMTDAPDSTHPDSVSNSHGGRGMNVLFGDLRVVFLEGCTIPAAGGGGQDHAFLNHDGEVAVGLNSADSVIGRSETPPRRWSGNHSAR